MPTPPPATFSFPALAGVPDAKADFGAKGDGTTDDTAALRAGIAAGLRSGKHVLYLPAGTYLVSGTLDYVDPQGLFNSFLLLQGAGASRTTIRLADGSAGFGDPANPKAVVRTNSIYDGQMKNSPDGSGVDAYRNYIRDLTVDAGSNAGAIGIAYGANNIGSIRDVSISGNGVAGLSFARQYAGPCLVKNLTVAGFAVGVDLAWSQYCVTGEHWSLSGQAVAGVRVADNSLFVRGLATTGLSCPSMLATGTASVCLLDSALSSPPSFASGTVRTLIRCSANGTSIDATSHPIAPLGSPAAAAMAVPETPDPPVDDPSNWAVVTWDSSMDHTAKIQAAIDSGATTVTFQVMPYDMGPPGLGVYRVSGTIHVRGNVRRFVGLNQTILPDASVFCVPGDPLDFFSIEVDHPVVFDGLSMSGGEAWRARWFAHSGAGDLVARDCDLGHYSAAFYEPTSSSCGDLYVEDVSALRMSMTLRAGQRCYARQLNLESDWPKLANAGSLWCLGYKTEQPGLELHNMPGGVAEIYGAFFFPFCGSAGSPPAIRADAGSSLVIANARCFGSPTAIQPALVGEPGGVVPRSVGVAGAGCTYGHYASAAPAAPAAETRYLILRSES